MLPVLVPGRPGPDAQQAALTRPRALPCLQRAKTDAFEGLEWDNPERPEARNLLTIYQCVTGEGRTEQEP
jgi:hypothetical protein